MTQSIVETSRNSQVERPPQFAEITPAVDIYENDKELLVLADLPRVARDSLTIEVNHPEMKIEGRVPATEKQREYRYIRTFQLDSTVDVSNIEAKISDGVLEVHLPKSEPFRVRKIEVTSA
jgi:HSP20 family molecular chaperone IbpA